MCMKVKDKAVGFERTWWPAWYNNDRINTLDEEYKKQRGSSLTRKNNSFATNRLGVQIPPSPLPIEDEATKDVTLNSSIFMGRLYHED